jgi:flagellar biosynthetic protein FliQ
MDSGFVIEVTFKALWMAFILSGPVLIALLVVGLVIGILQAATSVNDS